MTFSDQAATANFWHLRSSISHSHTGKLTSSLAPSLLGEKFDCILKQPAKHKCAPDCNRDRKASVKFGPLEERMHTFKMNKQTSIFFYLLPTGNASEGLDSALVGLYCSCLPSPLGGD